jgi:hypothetical protein
MFGESSGSGEIDLLKIRHFEALLLYKIDLEQMILN